MPNSFINTGGFSSPVMPGFQLADPRLFQVGQNLSRGIQSGVDISGEMQRQRMAAAMAPLQQQQIQESIDASKLQGKLAQRQLLQPVLIPQGEEVQNVPRPENIDQVGYQESIKNGMTDEQARSANTVPIDQQKFDQYKLQHFQNAETGETVSKPTLLKSAEDVQKEQEMAQWYGLRGDAGMITANANATRAKSIDAWHKMGGAQAMKPRVETGDDNKPHWMIPTYNPDTQQVESVQGGIATDSEYRAMNQKAKADEAESVVRKNDRTPIPETAEQKAASVEGAKISKSRVLFEELQKTPAGRAANIEAQINLARAKAGQSAKPLSPAAVKAEADAQAAIDARALPVAPVPMSGPSVGINMSEPQLGHHTDANGKGATYLGGGQWQLD